MNSASSNIKVTMKSFVKNDINIVVKEGEKHLWNKFAHHHYMDHTLPRSCVFYTFYWLQDDKEILVGCSGVIFQIAKNISARRFTRIVVLPEYQGLGFGSLIINTISKMYLNEGIKMYISTFHPRLGKYMTDSALWEPSHNNMKEFRKNDKASEGAMKGLRDGQKMYRFYFKQNNFKMVYNPIHVSRARSELKTLDKDSDEYKKLKKYLKSISPKEEEVTPKELTVHSENHIKSKQITRGLFNKPKRKPLTKEQRAELKQQRKIDVGN